jgi:seryl-tRNA synthetase
VYAFDGDEPAAALQSERAGRHEDWGEFQQMTELTLMPAACYPVYPAIAARGPLPAGGVFVDAGGAGVFRHEPSHDPARRQIFHQHELVRIGEPDAVLAWRDEWAQRGLELLRSLGLDAELDNASDPFFGRRGRMLATNQRNESLKLELLVQIAGPEPTALASFNHHRDHFGTTYGLELADGETAHTACLGFGHERIVLALLRTHGLDPAGWPGEVRAELWP